MNKIITEISKENKLQPGDYYVIDPCYVLYIEEDGEKGDWVDDFCTLLLSGRKSLFFKSEGLIFWCGSTAYGDGVYPVREEGKYIGECGVDAGLLAIIPVDLIEKHGSLGEAERLGVKVTINSELDVDYEGGDFSFGKYSVDTGGNAPDDTVEEDFWRDEEEEEDDDDNEGEEWKEI